MPKRPLTPQERAALDARDRALLERFLAREPAAERELVGRLNSLGKQVARRYWFRLYMIWNEFRGEYFILLYKWREDGKLREGESLRFLAQRLLKQAGRKAGVEAHRDQLAISFQESGRAPEGELGAEPRSDGGWEDATEFGHTTGEWVELQALGAIASQPRFADPETALATKETLEWLEAAAGQLSPGERATLEAEVAVARGEHEKLAEALGVKEGTSYNRRSSMNKALKRIARETFATDILERLEAASQAKPAKQPPVVSATCKNRPKAS